MKVIFEFDRYEDEQDLRLHLQAVGIASAVQDFNHYLKMKMKHEELPENVYDALEEARTKLWELMDQNEVRL